jgi:hypothetical protein
VDPKFLAEMGRRVDVATKSVRTAADLATFLAAAESEARRQGKVTATLFEPALAAIENVIADPEERARQSRAFSARMIALSSELDPDLRKMPTLAEQQPTP